MSNLVFNINKTNVLAKYKIIILSKKHFEIKTIQALRAKIKNNYNFEIQKKRPDYYLLKKTANASFDIFDYKYPLGLFAGCYSFSFRVTFKEYKIGLKPAKFSLLLNKFFVNLELFIDLIKELLINNFPLEFYEEIFGNYLNDIDFKIHFLVVLRPKRRKKLKSKFYIIPRGCFLTHLREQLWFSLFMDFFFSFFVFSYYKNLRTKDFFGIIFLLIIYYVYKLIHLKFTKLINVHKVYDYEERVFDSIGNFFSVKFFSYDLYLNSKLRLKRYSYLLSYRCLNFFMENDFDDVISILELNQIKKSKLVLESFFDLLVIDEDLKINETI